MQHSCGKYIPQLSGLMTSTCIQNNHPCNSHSRLLLSTNLSRKHPQNWSLSLYDTEMRGGEQLNVLSLPSRSRVGMVCSQKYRTGWAGKDKASSLLLPAFLSGCPGLSKISYLAELEMVMKCKHFAASSSVWCWCCLSPPSISSG